MAAFVTLDRLTVCMWHKNRASSVFHVSFVCLLVLWKLLLVLSVVAFGQRSRLAGIGEESALCEKMSNLQVHNQRMPLCVRPQLVKL